MFPVMCQKFQARQLIGHGGVSCWMTASESSHKSQSYLPDHSSMHIRGQGKFIYAIYSCIYMRQFQICLKFKQNRSKFWKKRKFEHVYKSRGNPDVQIKPQKTEVIRKQQRDFQPLREAQRQSEFQLTTSFQKEYHIFLFITLC